MKKVLIAAAAVLLLAVPALADGVAVSVTAPSTTIDLTQFATAALPFLFGFIIYTLRWGFLRICALLHVQNAAAYLTPLDDIAQQGLALAQSEMADEIARKGLTVDVKSALVARAGTYVAKQGQAQLASGKLDGAAVAEKLTAMIELNTTPAADSIAVPTPPPAASAAT